MVEMEMHACEAMIELLFVEIWLPAADGFVVETVLRASTQRTMSHTHTASDGSDGFNIVNLPVQLPIDDPLL
jgi:hypothetical protein